MFSEEIQNICFCAGKLISCQEYNVDLYFSDNKKANMHRFKDKCHGLYKRVVLLLYL